MNVSISGTATDAQSGINTVTIKVFDSYGEYNPSPVVLTANGAAMYNWITAIPLPASRNGSDK